MASFIYGKLQTLFGLFRFKALSQNFSSDASKRTWHVIRANHVAIATSDIQQSVKLYEDVLGIKTSQAVPQPDHGVTTVFIELSNMKLELLHPLGDKSPIEKFLQKSPNGGMHHICLEVDNIENAVKDLKEKNIRLLSDEPKIGAHGKPVIFLHPKDCNGVLIELEQV
ncbi:Methylmalonyl-CoA epimerase, mitochondrial [Araneus ventricosus]|uniref:Methylmalonyl-CoA epimerase, mitochondrial n=1 Tax=Araneus ventricosus TaxID=182803 RepID=A0A4Y2GUB8_ARAVE|nr:Methylmalonyl-CoA epimerase, mitochondrial [Araneus ventricosus]